jgi:transposase
VATIGIDIGGRTHVVARCRDGQPRADREILRVSQSRAGFAALDAWLERQIEDADRRVASLLDGETARRLQTIPGVGPSIAATLLAEIGDITRFTDFDQLLAYAGVHPAERSSGRKGANPETAWHMSKAGNSHLRAAAYRMAVVGVQHNPVIAAHYARKRAAGKSKMNALGHCMRKALSTGFSNEGAIAYATTSGRRLRLLSRVGRPTPNFSQRGLL